MKNLCFAIPIFYTAGDGPMAKAYSSLCLLVRCREHPFTQPTSFGCHSIVTLLSFSCHSIVSLFAFRVSGRFQKHYMSNFPKFRTADAFCLLKTKLLLCHLLSATATATVFFAPSLRPLRFGIFSFHVSCFGFRVGVQKHYR